MIPAIFTTGFMTGSWKGCTRSFFSILSGFPSCKYSSCVSTKLIFIHVKNKCSEGTMVEFEKLLLLAFRENKC